MLSRRGRDEGRLLGWKVGVGKGLVGDSDGFSPKNLGFGVSGYILTASLHQLTLHEHEQGKP